MKTMKIEIPDGKRAEWINGVLTLVDEPKEDDRPVTERIKTFEDACRELGEIHPFVRAYNGYAKNISEENKNDGDVIAYLKLRIITAALNEGWKPTFDEDECRYYPWFYIYTQKEYEELAEYCGKQFINEWADFLFA